MQPSQRESLVDMIFAKCALVYGRDFAGRWEGMNLAEVKADWARELGGLLDNPSRIKHGLEHLPPEKPPTVLSFRALCIGAPDIQAPQLKAPRASDELVKGLVAKMKAGLPPSRARTFSPEAE